MDTNILYYGDNLEILRDNIVTESVDLIYLDPPFNSKADYNLIFNEPDRTKSQAQIKAFDDTWSWDSEASAKAYEDLLTQKPVLAEFISWLSSQRGSYKSYAAYLSMMAIRLAELHRVLKPTGTLYLHCDPTASHYLKLLIDQIFGIENFRNEIIWCYSGGGIPKHDLPRKHDIIFRYTKTNKYTYHPEYRSYTEGTLQRGRTKVKGIYAERGLRKEGTPINDWWTDIAPIHSPTDPEKLGYPTQKRRALLERIINLSSSKGEIVLDPFCGCGTTIDAAEHLGRKWIGIDVTWLAIDLVEKRLKKTYASKLSTYKVIGRPYDYASAEKLAQKNKKEFEIWAISILGAAPREYDGGVDGLLGFAEKDGKMRKIIIQVKGGESLNPGMVRDLKGTLETEKAAIGLLVTLRDPTRGMSELAFHSKPYHSELWNRNYPSIQIRTINDLLNGKDFDLPTTQSLLKSAQLTPEPSSTKKLL